MARCYEMKDRIALIIPTMTGGGAERVVIEYLKYFAKQGIDADLVLYRLRGALLSEIPSKTNVCVVHQSPQSVATESVNSGIAANIRYYHEPKKVQISSYCREVLPNWPLWHRVFPRRKNRYVTQSYSLSKYFLDRKPKIAMAIMSNSFLCTVFGLRISRIPTKVICSVHGEVARGPTQPSNGRAYQTYRKLIKHADWVHTVSDGIRDDLIFNKMFPEKRISTIYNPAYHPNLMKLAEAPSSHDWLDKKNEYNYRIVLTVGNLTPAKNHRLLIDAFSLVTKKIPRSKLFILGEGSQRKELERQISRLGLTKDVALPGWIGNVSSFLHRCDVFVLSSNTEGFAIVLVEALALGCKIISTDCPHGPKEILNKGKFGILVAMNDKDALANAIIGTLTESSTYRFTNRRSLQLRAADFSIEKCGPNLLSLFDNLSPGFGNAPVMDRTPTCSQ